MNKKNTMPSYLVELEHELADQSGKPAFKWKECK